MMLDPLTILLALSVLLLVVLILGRAALTWGVIRARMWQGAYPWWDLKPQARRRYVLLHVVYFFSGATIYTVWGLLITFSSPGRPANFSVVDLVLSFVPTWVGAVFVGALLMAPPRAIAYVWHLAQQRNRPLPIQPSAAPLQAPPTGDNTGSPPQ